MVVHAVHLQQQVNEPHGTDTAIQHVILYAHYSVQGLVLQYFQISSHQLWKYKCSMYVRMQTVQWSPHCLVFIYVARQHFA